MGSKESRPDNREASKIYLDNDVWGRSYRRYCSVRAPHQLEFLTEPKDCDYCRIVRNIRVKTKYTCKTCHLTFCFTKDRNDFKDWHSHTCDHYRGYS